MSDNRKRPCIIRVLPVIKARVEAYATRQGLAPNVAAEDLMNGAAGEIAALDAAIVALRAELESAREATRRADAEVERLEADLTTAGEDLEAERRSDEAAHDAFRAEIDRLTRALEEATESARVANVGRARAEQTAADERAATLAAVRLVERRETELAEAKRTADKFRNEVERVTEERDTERRLDVAAQEALRADVAREIEANRKLESELAEARAALETKGATDRLAERLETIAVDVDRRACACALPAELDQRVRACIAARPNAVPPRDFAFVVKNGCDRIEGSDRYQDKIKAENAARRAEREAGDA